MPSRKDKETMNNKIFAAQEVLSGVVMELVKYNDTKELAYTLSGLNGKIDEVRKKLKE